MRTEMERYIFKKDEEEKIVEQIHNEDIQALDSEKEKVELDLEEQERTHERFKCELDRVRRAQVHIDMHIDNINMRRKLADQEFIDTLSDPDKFIKYAKCLNNSQIEFLQYQVGRIIDIKKKFHSGRCNKCNMHSHCLP